MTESVEHISQQDVTTGQNQTETQNTSIPETNTSSGSGSSVTGTTTEVNNSNNPELSQNSSGTESNLAPVNRPPTMVPPVGITADDASDNLEVAQNSAGTLNDLTSNSAKIADNSSVDGTTGWIGSGMDVLGGGLNMGLGAYKARKAYKQMHDTHDAGEKRRHRGDFKSAVGSTAEGTVSLGKGVSGIVGASGGMKETTSTLLGQIGGGIIGGIQAAMGIKRAFQEGRRAGNVSKLSLKTTIAKKWQNFISGKKKSRMAVNIGKALLGGLSIAGAVATGPVGAALAIGAGLTGVGLFAMKKYKERKARNKKRAAIEKINEKRLSNQQEPLTLDTDEGNNASMKGMVEEQTMQESMDRVNQTRQSQGNEPLSLENEEGITAAKQNKDQNKFEGTDKLTKAHVAIGIHEGVKQGDANKVINEDSPSNDDKLNYDSGALAGGLGLQLDEVKSSSGPALIEKKISVTGSM